MNTDVRHLAALRFLAIWWSQGESGQEPHEFRRMFEHYLDALVALNAISPDAHKLWRKRIHVVVDDDGRMLTSLTPAVEAELERAFAEVPETIEPMTDHAFRLNALIGAAHMLGALPQDGARAWAMRIGERLASTTPPPTLDPQEERRMRMLTEAPPRGKLLRVFRGPELRQEGLRIRFVELYEHGVTACWHFVSTDEDWPRRLDHLGHCVELRDDRGTEYFGRGGGGSSTSTTSRGVAVVEGHDDFVPAPPPDVRTLTIDYLGHEIRVDIPPRS